MDDVMPRRVFAGYFVVQALVGIGFWVVLATSSEVRSGFELLESEHAVTDSFLFADVSLGILGSLAAAGAIYANKRCATVLAAFVAGSITYATLYILAWVIFTGTGGVMLGIMVPPAVLSCFMAYQVWRAAPSSGA